MAIPTYVSGFPPDGTSLGATKAQIRSNLDGTFQTVAVNHFDNNDANAGQHMFIQFPNSSVAPPAPNGANECDLYNGAGSIGGANNIFFLPPGSTTLADSIQMTRNEKPVDSASGYSWLPGGFLFQWGQHNLSSPVVLNVDMTAIYNIQITPIGTAVPNNPAVGIKVTSVNTGVGSNFTFAFTNPSTGVSGFYWIAIGK